MLVALSTLYTKQHYVADVVAGVVLACVAYLTFLKSYPRDRVSELERRVAPLFTLGGIAIVGLGVAVFWIAYQLKLLS